MTARQKCIELAKKIAVTRDKFTCQKCGKKKGTCQIHGSHIIPVSARGLISADPENICALCASCHKFAGDSWHEAPLAQEWFNRKFPGRYERLKSKHINEPIKTWQWEERLEELKREWRQIEEERRVQSQKSISSQTMGL